MADVVTTHPLIIQQGDGHPLVWDLTDQASGQPVDLTGYGAAAQVREHVDSDVVLHEWSTDLGNAVFAESSLSLKVDDSMTWTWRLGVYDLQITDPAGTPQTLDRGPVVVIPAVTRPTL